MERAFGPYTISSTERVLRLLGQPVAIAPKALDVLFALSERPGEVISKAELMDTAWPEAWVDESNLTQNIYLLRNLFREHKSGVGIENIPKRGYRLVVSSVTPRTPRIQARSHHTLLTTLVAGAIVLLLAVAFAPRFTTLSNGVASRQLSGAALRAYLLGRACENAGSRADLARGAALFADVIRAEPESALGYAALSETDGSLAFYAADVPARTQLQADALTLANEAVRRDPDAAESFAALGVAEFSLDHRNNTSYAHFKRALSLDPNNVSALAWAGTLLLGRGDVERARRMFSRAVAIAPNAAGTLGSLAWSDFLTRNYSAAITLSKQQMLAHQQTQIATLTLANAYLMLRDFRDASKAIGRLGHRNEVHVQVEALSASADALNGHLNAATTRLRSIEQNADPSAMDEWDVASIAAAYVALGERSQAMVWLARVPPWQRGEIAHDPRFAAVSGAAEFLAWVRS